MFIESKFEINQVWGYSNDFFKEHPKLQEVTEDRYDMEILIV